MDEDTDYYGITDPTCDISTLCVIPYFGGWTKSSTFRNIYWTLLLDKKYKKKKLIRTLNLVRREDGSICFLKKREKYIKKKRKGRLNCFLKQNWQVGKSGVLIYKNFLWKYNKFIYANITLNNNNKLTLVKDNETFWEWYYVED